MEITSAVYDALKASTEEISKTVAEMEAVNGKIDSGRYSKEAVKNELAPRRDELRRKIQNDSDKAIDSAREIIKAFVAQEAKKDDLDPAEITDDIRLLQAGVPLLPRDLEAIMQRNKGNRTMRQLVYRYGKERGIEVSGYRPAIADANEIANGLDSTLKYYRRWIDKGNALPMLARFFNR